MDLKLSRKVMLSAPPKGSEGASVLLKGFSDFREPIDTVHHLKGRRLVLSSTERRLVLSIPPKGVVPNSVERGFRFMRKEDNDFKHCRKENRGFRLYEWKIVVSDPAERKALLSTSDERRRMSRGRKPPVSQEHFKSVPNSSFVSNN